MPSPTYELFARAMGSSHSARNTCVKIVDFDVNPHSPYGPKRKLGDLIFD